MPDVTAHEYEQLTREILRCRDMDRARQISRRLAELRGDPAPAPHADSTPAPQPWPHRVDWGTIAIAVWAVAMLAAILLPLWWPGGLVGLGWEKP